MAKPINARICYFAVNKSEPHLFYETIGKEQPLEVATVVSCLAFSAVSKATTTIYFSQQPVSRTIFRVHTCYFKSKPNRLTFYLLQWLFKMVYY